MILEILKGLYKYHLVFKDLHCNTAMYTVHILFTKLAEISATEAKSKLAEHRTLNLHLSQILH